MNEITQPRPGQRSSRNKTQQLAVLQVILGLDPALGGPPVAAVATALGIRRHRASSDLAFPVARGREAAHAELLALLRSGGSVVHVFDEPAIFGHVGFRWGISPDLAIWLLRRAPRFDVIHMHSGWAFTTAVGLIVAKLYGRIAVLTPHESLTDYDRAKSGPLHRALKRMLRWLYVRLFDVIVVASPLELSDMGRNARQRSVVVPHAVMGVSGTRSARQTPNGLRVGFIGRLDPKKNVELLIEAVAALPDSVSLRVAGDGPDEYRRRLIAHAADRGVNGRVHWLGFLDAEQKPGFFASIDVLAMPSEFECFGVSAAEALIAGVPVVVSSRVGVADIVSRYECGHVTPPTAGAIERSLRELSESKNVLDKLAMNTHGAADEFSVERHGERLVVEYERVLGARLQSRRTRADSDRGYAS